MTKRARLSKSPKFGDNKRRWKFDMVYGSFEVKKVTLTTD